MRYDEGCGRSGGWETRMPDGGRGWHGGYPTHRGGEPAVRPWVGGYRDGYQGGSGGYALGTSGPLYASYDAFPGGGGRERGRRRPRGQEGERGTRRGGYFVRARAGYGGGFGGGEGGGPGYAGDPYADGRPGFGELGRMGGGGGGTGRGRHGGASRGGYGGYGGEYGSRGGYGRDFGARGGYGGEYGSRGGYGRDDGSRGGGAYDLPFRNEGRPEDYHPRYSPVGGTWAPMGGSCAAYPAGRPPRAVSDTHWTSDETRWF